MDELVFKVRRPERKGAANIVRVSSDAMTILEDLQTKTGHAISYLASEMIIFADDHCRVEDDSESNN